MEALTDALAAEIVGRGSKCLGLGEIECEEGTATPANHKAREFDDRKSKQLPRNPQIECDAFPGGERLAGRRPTAAWMDHHVQAKDREWPCLLCPGHVLGFATGQCRLAGRMSRLVSSPICSRLPCC